jgi:hypothetical protein
VFLVLFCWASIRRGIDVVFVLSSDTLLLEHLPTESLPKLGNGSPQLSQVHAPKLTLFQLRGFANSADRSVSD